MEFDVNNVTMTKSCLTRTTYNQLQKRFIAFDTETTGLRCDSNRIIELGAVVYENGEIVDKFSSLINTHKMIPYQITKITNITNDMVNEAPEEDEVYKAFIKFLGNAMNGETIICAHNATFDMKFLANTFDRLGYTANFNYIDTLALSRKYLKDKLDNFKQGTIANYFDIDVKNAHRAADDARVCGSILCNLLELYNDFS